MTAQNLRATPVFAPGAATSSAVVRGSYRPDVDGLRAIAVGLVIAFHLFSRAVPNGYVGVDVFFVISGYVVTSSLAHAEGPSTIRNVLAFWRRRFVRIYPALSACVLGALVAVLAVLPPFPFVEYAATIRTGISALLGIANLYLLRSSQNYFTSDQSNDPFIHMWSLGVEEQFYLLFSLVFIALPLLSGLSGARLRRARFGVVGALTLGSLLIMLRTQNASAAYYLLPSRFWELGIGSLLALIGSAVSAPRRLRGTVGGLSLAAIFALALSPAGHDARQACGIGAACTALLIWANGPGFDMGLTGRVLAVEPIRQAGLRSYSLYLWHWPVIVLFRLTVGLQSPATLGGAVAVSWLLAWASYRFVEAPLRAKGASFTRHVAPLAAVLVMASVGIGVVAQLRPGLLFTGRPHAWMTDWLPDRDFAYVAPGLLRAKDCDLISGPVPASVPAVCSTPDFRAPGSWPSILLIGDSMAYADWGMLAKGSENGTFAWASVAADGCNIEKAFASETCRAYWATMDARILSALDSGGFIFLAPLWSLGDHADHRLAKTRIAHLAALAEHRGLRLIIQAPLPQFATNAFVCTRETFRLSYEGCSVSRSEFEAQRLPIMAYLSALQAQHPAVLVWDPTVPLCDALCSEIGANGRPLFRNWDHLSYFGSRSLGPSFADFIRAHSRQGRGTAS